MQQGFDLELQFRLETGKRFDGPANIEEKNSTAIVYLRQKAGVVKFLNLKVQWKDSKQMARAQFL